MERFEDIHRRRVLMGAAAVCWIGALALAIVVHRTQRPFAVDKFGFRVVQHRLFGIPIVPRGIATDLVRLGNIRDFAIALCALVAASLLIRDRLAALLAIAPPVAVVMTEVIAKPIVGRRSGGVYSFPSGHATAVSALAMYAAILGYRRWGRRHVLSRSAWRR
jgi:membrane-associated phospholipid phosphatase